jgi:hypothetical protein
MEHLQFDSCIRACYACAAECDNCATACLHEADPRELAECIALDLDCADICRTAAAFMARASENSEEICAVCAEICSACADECRRHPMEHCRACAEAALRCADECERMSPFEEDEEEDEEEEEQERT